MALRIETLERADARAEATTTAVREELDRVRQKQVEADQRTVVLEATVKELKAASEKRGQRWWQLAATLVVAIVSGTAGYLLKR